MYPRLRCLRVAGRILQLPEATGHQSCVRSSADASNRRLHVSEAQFAHLYDDSELTVMAASWGRL